MGQLRLRHQEGGESALPETVGGKVIKCKPRQQFAETYR
jgi:hypothetical protein